MAFKSRLCKNNTTDYIRETFAATPLKVPEARMAPLIVLASHNDETKFRGDLKFLLKDTAAFNIAINTTPVADVAMERTRKMDINAGFNILDGFFKALQFSPITLGLVLKGVKEISLSFSNTQRNWVDLGQLGQAVRNNTIDTQNPALGVFTGEEPADMLLITDAIVSPSFTINDESGSDTSFDASIPLIEKVIADGKLGVQVEKTAKTSISFTNTIPLTFAFSCVKLKYHPETGSVSIMENVTPRKSKGANGQQTEETTPLVLLDDDDFHPGLLSVD